MSAKEIPDWRAGGFQESRFFASTPEQSHQAPPNASQKTSEDRKKEPKAGTQRAIVLALLRSRPGQFVGVAELMREARCAATHTVVSVLRHKYGFRIENRLRRSAGGVMLSEYQLEEEAR